MHAVAEGLRDQKRCARSQAGARQYIRIMQCTVTDALCEQLNEVVTALNDPWDGFLGVLTATLLGAVIGAGAAYVFSRLLRSQQLKDERATRTAIAETERIHRLDDSLRATVLALGELSRAYVVSGLYPTPENHADVVRAGWLASSSLRTTRLSMSKEDLPVPDAAFNYLLQLHSWTGEQSLNADRLARLLLLWRSGERDARWTLEAFDRKHNPAAPNQ